MRRSEARDLRSFLAEPVEEIVVEGAKERLASLQQNTHVGARFTSPLGGSSPSGSTSPLGGSSSLQETGAPLYEVGVQFIPPWKGTDGQLQGAGVHFTTAWEGTGGQLHEVGARFTGPLGTKPLEADPDETTTRTTDDFTLQQTMPITPIAHPVPGNVGARFTSPPGNASPSGSTSPSGTASPWGLTTPPPANSQGLRPYRLQRYQSRGAPMSSSRSASGVVGLRPAGEKAWIETADLAPAPQKIVPGEPSPARQGWEKRRHELYAWLVLLLLFLLVVLGGIGLDSLIASYR